MTESLLPRSRPLTRVDLDAMPEDGHRYELVDGTLIVSSAPSIPHQRVVGRLYLALAGCPAYWVVDPAEPSLRAWELRDGAYVEVGHVVGAEAFRTTRPFPVEVTPSTLTD